MPGFIRRFNYSPTREQITAIEGAIIIDLPPPGSINGVGTGVVCVVGEFADCTSAVAVSATGVVTTNPRPVAVQGSADLVTQGGGFDATIGKFGSDMGNGFVSVVNKRFAGLVLAPVDILTPASTGQQATVRLWRELPTNQSATVAQPITPVGAAGVAAGTEFKYTSSRVRTASRAVFTDDIAYAAGVDGAITAAGGPATSQTFNAAGGAFTTVVRNDGSVGVAEGDILVLGVLGGAGALGANAGTYRVVSVTSATALVVEKLAGTSFNWTTGTAQPWRLHLGRTADTSPTAHQLSEAGGYSVLARPLDATITAASALAPTVAPTAPSATFWDVLSGLAGAVHPSVDLTYDANLHAPNVASNATLEARYTAAMAGTLNDNDGVSNTINIIVASRKTSTIRTALRAHVLAASARGLTRRTIVAPAVNVLTLATVLGDTDPGVGANRNERVDYAWPALSTLVPQAVGSSVATSDAKTTTDGVLDVPADEWLAAVESNLAPELNPGQAQPPVPEVMALATGFARGAPALDMTSYISLRAKGIAAPRYERSISSFVFQSGVTTSLNTGEKNISRRRMADFIQDSIANAIAPFAKLPPTDDNKDTVVAQATAFLDVLLNQNSGSAQRISGYVVDPVSANTDDAAAAGIFTLVVRVRLLGSMDFLPIIFDIGEGVVLPRAA